MLLLDGNDTIPADFGESTGLGCASSASSVELKLQPLTSFASFVGLLGDKARSGVALSVGLPTLEDALGGVYKWTLDVGTGPVEALWAFFVGEKGPSSSSSSWRALSNIHAVTSELLPMPSSSAVSKMDARRALDSLELPLLGFTGRGRGRGVD